MSEDDDQDQMASTDDFDHTPDQPAPPKPSASADPVEKPAHLQPLDDPTVPYFPSDTTATTHDGSSVQPPQASPSGAGQLFLLDLLIRAATPHTAPADRAPTTTVSPAGFTFPNTTAPDASPGAFCGTALPSAPTPLTSSHPHDDISTAEHFLDDYFQRHISEQDEAQYDAFNDHQLDYHH